MKNKILFVIVLYKQKLWDCKTYNTIIKHNNNYPLFIYDNSPENQHSQDDFADNVKYISDTSNSGLSFANNCAAYYAREMGLEWILLLDQDTNLAPNILDEYCEAIINNPNIKLFAPPMQILNEKYISPVSGCLYFVKPANNVPFGVVSFEKYLSINSGLMINVEAFIEVGGYNENVPLDFCEYQFQQRLKKKYKHFYVLKSVCVQEFSDEVQNAQQKLNRFRIFCQCLKNCEKDTFIDRMGYLYIVIKRASNLTLFCRTFEPLRIASKIYFSL